MTDLWALLTWAAQLSGYPMPETLPVVVEEPHAFFVAKLCRGVETPEQPCPYVGRYNDTRVIWIDERLQGELRDVTLVHEMVHYLQHLSGRYTGPPTCEKQLDRENEAYRVGHLYAAKVQKRISVWKPRLACRT
jgi:hypothetical protein